jgi:peptide deformylase
MRTILTVPNPILREISKSATNFGTSTQNLIDEMIEILTHDPYGVGLAAPQIGEPLRLILVTEISKKDRRIILLLNPEISFFSKEFDEDYEGCLSIPYRVGLITRSTKIKVKAQDRNGNKLNLRAAGFFAREIQHEVDHINGILFPDRTTPDKIFNYIIDEKGKWVIQDKNNSAMRTTL